MKRNVRAVRFGTFATRGVCGKFGKPSESGLGSTAWVSLIFEDGSCTPWFCYATYGAEEAASKCAHFCMFHLYTRKDFFNAVFNAPIDKTSQPKMPVVSKDNNNTTVGIDGKGLAQLIVRYAENNHSM